MKTRKSSSISINSTNRLCSRCTASFVPRILPSPSRDDRHLLVDNRKEETSERISTRTRNRRGSRCLKRGCETLRAQETRVGEQAEQGIDRTARVPPALRIARAINRIKRIAAALFLRPLLLPHPLSLPRNSLVRNRMHVFLSKGGINRNEAAGEDVMREIGRRRGGGDGYLGDRFYFFQSRRGEFRLVFAIRSVGRRLRRSWGVGRLGFRCCFNKF